MIEVSVTKKLNEKKYVALISFLYSLSSEIAFTSFHHYHVEEDDAVELINEYKQRCKEKHREVGLWYEKKEPFLMKVLKKLHIDSEEEFLEYKEHIFQVDMSLCKKMEEVLDKLIEDTSTVDYNEVFSSIKDDFKELETHMFDSTTISVFPLDLIVYNASDNIFKLLLSKKKTTVPILENTKEHAILINPVFCKNDDAFAVISTENGSVTMALDEKQYQKFKQLKIRHTKEETEK